MDQRTVGNSWVHLEPLLKMIEGAGLETAQNFYVGPLSLTIGRGVCHRRVAHLDFQILAVVDEGITGELGSMVSEEAVGNAEATDKSADELDSGSLVNLDDRLRFHQSRELVEAT